MESYAKKAMDKEIEAKINIVKTFNTALPGHIAKIKSKAIKDESNNRSAGTYLDGTENIFSFGVTPPTHG